MTASEPTRLAGVSLSINSIGADLRGFAPHQPGG
jgi:hypothetical protein